MSIKNISPENTLGYKVLSNSYDGLEQYLANNPVEIVEVSIESLPEDAIVMPKEVSTQNSRSLFNTAAEVLGGMDRAKNLILTGLSLDLFYLETKSKDVFERLSLNHLLNSNYWISNNLSAQIYIRAEKALKGTILGEDPLYEAGKLFGVSFPPWQLASFKFMSLKEILILGKLRNETYNTITNISFVQKKGHVLLSYTYKENITRTPDEKAIAKQVCDWNRGVWHYFSSLLGLKNISIKETACIHSGDNECIFKITYSKETLKNRVKKMLLSLLEPDLISSYEKSIRMEHIANYNLSRSVEQKTAELKKLSNTDYLTQINNRGFFDISIEEYTKLSARASNKPISVILFDIDHFKKVNDTYGHPCGDTCLKLVAQTIKAILCRESDFVARYGGEEFVVVLPFTDTSGAILVAERIRKAIETMTIPLGENENIGLTVSAGVATGIPDKDSKKIDKNKLIEDADRGLYLAKSMGRNVVKFWPQS